MRTHMSRHALATTAAAALLLAAVAPSVAADGDADGGAAAGGGCIVSVNAIPIDHREMAPDELLAERKAAWSRDRVGEAAELRISGPVDRRVETVIHLRRVPADDGLLVIG